MPKNSIQTLYPTIDAEGSNVELGWGGQDFVDLVEDGSDLTATISDTTNESGTIYIYRSNNTYNVRRYFVEFNTSGINHIPESATFNFHLNSNVPPHADTIGIKTEFNSNGAIVADDWDGHDESNPIAYTDILLGTNWINGFNVYTLTSAALEDMKNRDYFQMVIIEANYDYTQTNLPNLSTFTIDYITADAPTSPVDLRPKILYQMKASAKISSGNVTINSGKLFIK